MKKVHLWILAGIAAIGCSAAWVWDSGMVSTDNAFVEADVHPVNSRIAGDVVEVLVEDNQPVEKGQVWRG